MVTRLPISHTFALAGDLTINRLGYGAMRLTGQPGNFGPYSDWEGGQQLLRRAVELGINFIDTAEAYGPGFNEELIAAALHPYPQNLVIATKGGINKPAPDNIQADGRPENLRRGDVLDYCTKHGIAFIPYGSLGANPLKRGAPLAVAEGVIADIAKRHHAKPNQIALAWMLHRAPNIILIPETTTIAHVEENIAAASIRLSAEEFEALSLSK